jgi:actin related protein 2/3 complex, subunit 1A/1B
VDRVTDLSWHPNSQLLATASTDLKCRVFSAYIPEVDSTPDAGPFPQLAAFGEPLAEFDNASAWVNAVAWSPQGNRLAFAGHGSSIHFVHFGRPGEYPTVQSIRFSQLPLNKILFLSNDSLVGAGYEFNVLLFATDAANSFWSLQELLDKKPAESAIKRDSGSFNAARHMWESKVSRGQSSDATNSDKGALWTKHESAITDIQPYDRTASGSISAFTTSGTFFRIQFRTGLQLTLVADSSSARWSHCAVAAPESQRANGQAASVGKSAPTATGFNDTQRRRERDPAN